jgi:hypothetical protein
MYQNYARIELKVWQKAPNIFFGGFQGLADCLWGCIRDLPGFDT